MADGWQTYPIEFTGGLITNLAPIQQGINLPGSARQLRNFEPSTEGGYRRINGFDKFSSTVIGDTNITTTGLVRGIFYYGGKVVAIRNNNSGGEGEIFESAGATWTRISDNSNRLAASSNKVRGVKYNFDGTQRLLMVDGAGYPVVYNGTSCSALSTLSTNNAKHVAVFKDHVFLGVGNKVVHSASLSDTDYSVAAGGNEISFDDDITGLQVFRNQLFIFTERQIHKITGTSGSDFVREPVSMDLGCVAEDTIQEIAGDIVFMGPDGLRLLSGTARIGDVGLGAVTKTIQSQVLSFLNKHNSFSSLIIREKSQYRIFGYVGSASVSEANGIIGTQFASQGGEGNFAWAETRGIKAYTTCSEYSGTEELIFFANNDGYVYQLEKTISFDGTPIEASFFTPFLPINDPTLRKTMYVVHSYIDPDGSFSTEMALNYDFDEEIRPDPITLSNNISSEEEFGVYGTSSFATWEVDASANVNGAVSDSTAIVLDGNSGTIEVGQYVSGTGIVGTPTVATVTDQNNITLSSVQTLDDDTALSFSDHDTAQTSTIFGEAVRVNLRKQVTGSGFVVSLEFTTDPDTATQPFTLDAVALEYATNSRR